jgi:hypothetical protein
MSGSRGSRAILGTFSNVSASSCSPSLASRRSLLARSSRLVPAALRRNRRKELLDWWSSSCMLRRSADNSGRGAFAEADTSTAGNFSTCPGRTRLPALYVPDGAEAWAGASRCAGALTVTGTVVILAGAFTDLPLRSNAWWSAAACASLSLANWCAKSQACAESYVERAVALWKGQSHMLEADEFGHPARSSFQSERTLTARAVGNSFVKFLADKVCTFAVDKWVKYAHGRKEGNVRRGPRPGKEAGRIGLVEEHAGSSKRR